jgi:membrane protein DedA with SNARE-associated domain
MAYTETFLNYLNSVPDPFLYAALGLSAFAENLLPPIPGDTITAFGAFLVGVGKLNFLGVYMATTLGSVAGFMSLFWIGRSLGRRFFLDKDYRFFRAEDIRKADDWFEKYGYMLIAVNRFLPGIRSAISVAGGISRLATIKVSMLALVSSGIWNFIWIMAGYFLGTNWEVVRARMSGIMMRYNIAVFLVLLLFVGFAVFRKKLRQKD